MAVECGPAVIKEMQSSLHGYCENRKSTRIALCHADTADVKRIQRYVTHSAFLENVL